MNSRTKQILEDMRRQRELDKLRKQQKQHALDKNINTTKNVVTGLPKTIDNAKKVVDFGKKVSDGIKTGESIGNAVKAASMATKAANTANTVSNAANAANTASNVANTASTVGNAAGAASTAAGAMPVVGAALGGLSAANNFSKGNHVDGALDLAKTGAMFIPGVGWAVAGAIQIGQMIKNAINKKKAKKQQANMKKMAETEQLANEKKQENLAELDQASQAVNTIPQQNMLESSTSPTNVLSEQIAQATQPTGLNEDYIGSDGNPDIMAGYQPTEEVEPTEESKPNWGQNILDAMNAAQGLGASKEAIDAIPQGLNSGNKDIAALIDKYRVNKPTTPEEIELARAGKFNTPEVPVENQGVVGELPQLEKNEPSRKEQIIADMMKKFKGGLNNFAEGYKDNAYTSFSEGDLAKGITGAAASVEPKTIMNKLGEAIGTGSRVISNPGLQGLVAGAIKGANTGDWGTGLEYGVNWAANKAKSDNYYKRMNPNAKRAPIFSNYDSKDYNAYTLDNYRTLNANKNMQSATALANAMLGAGRWTEEEAQNFINANGADTLIPTNVFNYLLKDNQAENKITADMTKHSDNHGETVRHNKETENIGKTNAGANVTRAGAYVKKVENEAKGDSNGDGKYYPGGKPVTKTGTKTGKMVRVLAPDKKTIRFIPEEKLEAAIEAGGTLL